MSAGAVPGGPRLVRGAEVVPMRREDLDAVTGEAQLLAEQFTALKTELAALRAAHTSRSRRERLWLILAIALLLGHWLR